MDSALSPREIQARIRSGARVADVADEASVSVEDVEPFAVPVLAELDHVVSTALDGPIRHRSNPSSRRSLRSVVDRVATKVGFDPDDLTWSARRLADRSWEVCARWHGEQGPADPLSDDLQSHVATFRFDQHTRRSRPLDAGARWLTDDRVSASRTRETENPDEEPTVDLNDELAIVRAVSESADRHFFAGLLGQPEAPGTGEADQVDQPSGAADTRRAAQRPRATTDHDQHSDEAEQDIASSTEQADTPTSSSPTIPGMTSTNGVYDFVPSTDSQMDALYEAVAGFQEDSVNIYEGLNSPMSATATSDPDDDSSTTAEQVTNEDDAADTGSTQGQVAEHDASGSDTTPDKDSATPDDDKNSTKGPKPGQTRKKQSRKRRKRASIPSWDEIMFGGPAPHA